MNNRSKARVTRCWMVVVFSLTIHGVSPQAQSSSLYERLGGMEQIFSIVNETIERTPNDLLPNAASKAST